MAIKVNTSYLKDFISEEEYRAIVPEIEAACVAQRDGSGQGADFLGWHDLPFEYNRREFARIKETASYIQNNADVLVVIGIGGSYIGARAVIELLGSQFFNETSKLKVYFAGCNISGDYLNRIIKQCSGKRVCINVVSKSGTTTEPALAFRVFKSYMESRYGVEGARERIFVTTDKEKGVLRELSEQAGYETFVIPDDVGGRFSVLTAVGLLPIAAAGFDIDELMRGAADAARSYSDDSPENPANIYAAVRNILYRKGRTVEMLCCYEPNFTSFLEWWKQLYGESEGKDGKGILPASLVFSTDLHSMGQYMQDGLRMMFETVVRFETQLSDLEICPEDQDFDGLNYLAGKSMSCINATACDATILAHTEGGVPCLTIDVPGFDAHSVGELIYFFEYACGVSAYVLGVNPFNQPGVEDYKKNMFALLGKPGFEKKKKELEKKLN